MFGWLRIEAIGNQSLLKLITNVFIIYKAFLGFLEKERKEFKVFGRGDFVLKEKLRSLKSSLKWWNTNVFGKVDLEMEEGVMEINHIDEYEEEDDIGQGARCRANSKF